MPRSGRGLLRKQQGFNLSPAQLPPVCADSRFAKPRKFPKGNGFTFFSLLRKEPKVAQRVATLWTPRDGSKLYRLYFFVTFPALIPKPVCDATRFFGCFEPVRKGCYSADARPIFFENGLLYCKLTGANVFKKGSSRYLYCGGICFCGMRIEISKYAKVFASF